MITMTLKYNTSKTYFSCMLYAAHLRTFYFALCKCALHYVKLHTTRMYSHASRKICDSFALQNWGSTYMRVTNFSVRQMMSAEIGTEGRFAP